MTPLLCRFRFHDWRYIWAKRICRPCGRTEEPIYDMAYGGTYWRQVS